MHFFNATELHLAPLAINRFGPQPSTNILENVIYKNLNKDFKKEKGLERPKGVATG
jgi:hypothetical protein